MTGKFTGKTVVVIGGSSGIGFAVAEAAQGEGAQVVIASSGQGHVDAALARLGGRARGAAVDVTDEPGVARFFETLGPFDHLVYTAGDWGAWRNPAAFADMDIAAAHAVFAVRFWGAVTAVKHGHRHIPPGGSITLTDGMVAHRPRKGAPLSTAMAGAVEHLVRGLAADLSPIRVNGVCPGLVLTEVWNAIPADQREQRLQAMTQRQPLPRGGQPSELAEAYLYLMSGGFTTGQVLQVDGGMGLV